MQAGRNSVVVASGNPGKLEEIRQLLGDLDVRLVAQSELGIESPEETGATFRENALIKARHAALRSGLPAIADDSGLSVDALGGRPGVYSARYAGTAATADQNIDKLLGELAGLGSERRNARFHCVAVFVLDGGDSPPLVAEGVWPGRILTSRRGRGGFGYDPVFFDPLAGKAAAEMTADEKNRVSHRGRALHELRRLLDWSSQDRT